jgi:hypothetical protein
MPDRKPATITLWKAHDLSAALLGSFACQAAPVRGIHSGQFEGLARVLPRTTAPIGAVLRPKHRFDDGPLGIGEVQPLDVRCPFITCSPTLSGVYEIGSIVTPPGHAGPTTL